MKKTIALLLILILGISQLSCFAAIGDVIAYAKYTDILAYINGFIVPSYNIEDYTGVVAEDLTYYGFDVVWNQENRTLNITRNNQTDIVTYLRPYEVSPSNVGRNAYQVLSTDIKTFVNGSEVKSYNINGRTVIIIDSLAPYGDVVWNGEAREISLNINDGLEKSSSKTSPTPLNRVTVYSADGRELEILEEELNAYLQVGWYKTKEEAKSSKNLSKNLAKINSFYVGQQVSQTIVLFGSVCFGTVRDIDYNNGKVKVYWTRAEDMYGNERDYTTATLYLGLHKETWENASSLNPLY